MSFQGDVAGIGLGELLQGLSRGGQDGVLSLYGERISASLGLHRGQLFLLAGPDEEQETWRERCAQAFAMDPFPEKEQTRRAAIARAARQETIFEMLGAPNLHFRFEPGPLPMPPGYAQESSDGALTLDSAPATQDAASVWGAGITVEYMLLEYARISDEASSGPVASIHSHSMPRAMDVAREALPEVRDFLEQCDGSSTVQEIADRLGRPQVEVANSVGSHVRSGSLRMAAPREILAAAQSELENGHLGRAATRLAGWVADTPPGPPNMGDCELLVREWDRGRLQHLLPTLECSVARELFTKLDHVHVDREAAHRRWQALAAAHRTDELSCLREVVLRLVSSDEPDTRSFHDILRIARSWQERGNRGRSQTLLRLASNHLPTTARTRIELGRRFIETGLVEEGTRWLLNTANDLIADKEPDSAVSPLLAVLREDPDNEEAAELLELARSQQTKKKRRKMHSAVGLSLGAMLSLVAFVQYTSYRKVDGWVTKFQVLQDSPVQALNQLQQEFGDSPPERIVELQAHLQNILRTQKAKDLENWQAKFDEAMETCSFGDPKLGLQRTFDLPQEPGPASAIANSYIQDLLGALVRKLEADSESSICDQDATANERNAELRFLEVLEEIAVLAGSDEAPPEAESFNFHVEEMIGAVEERREEWLVAHATAAHKQQAQSHSILLATARAHANSGDLERAIKAYERLLEEDPGLREVPELMDEIAKARLHLEAAQLAMDLALAGDHEGAAAALREVCERPLEHPLPFHVRTRPEGARVTLGSGEVHTTPFVIKSGVGEALELSFSKLGYERRTLQMTQPANLNLHLHKLPERNWENSNQIEALPIATGNDHILADRHGQLRRVDGKGKTIWSRELRTLSGIARTPVFLPGIPGHLLVISEDGQAWIVNAADGVVQGPRKINSPPMLGPLLTRGGVTVSFADGRVGVWNDSLEPAFFEGKSYAKLEDEEVQSRTMAVLKRSVDRGQSLESPWNQWVVQVLEDEYQVSAPNGRGFTVSRSGEWVYLAWEAPKALVPEGRLWVSDSAGVRSYVPTQKDLMPLDD